jgi:hypothetical protein
MPSWKHGDLQVLCGFDERTKGAHLPQEEKVAVSQVQPGEDADAEAGAKFAVTYDPI